MGDKFGSRESWRKSSSLEGVTMYSHDPQYKRKKVARRTVDKVRLHERRQMALSLRMAGASYSEIVKAKIGYNNVQMVSHDMRKTLEAFTYETPEDVLVLDLARIDEIQKILTAALRTGDLGQAGPIMRCMQFRRETLGITPEVIGERRQNAQQVTNNGIMVVQGTTGDYIAAMAAASGADPKEVRRELEQVSKSNNYGNKEREVIDAEVVPETKKRIRIKRKTAQKETEPQTANLSGSEVLGLPRTPKRTAKLSETSPDPAMGQVTASTDSLLDRFEHSASRNNRAEQTRENIPAIGLSESLLEVDIPGYKERTIAVPIKDYDQNVQVTSGVSYKKPPRKMTKDESKKVVLRKLRKPGSSTHSIETPDDSVDVMTAVTTVSEV